MNTNTKTATIYVWENQSNFNTDYLLWVLGGRKLSYDETKSPEILKMFNRDSPKPRTYLTKEYVINQYGKHCKKTQKGNQYSTPMLEQRMKKLSLEMPEHELRISPRTTNRYQTINLTKIAAIAHHLIETMNAKHTLAVKGTDIENTVLYASKEIQNKVTQSILKKR